jgi:hypothetical protein
MRVRDGGVNLTNVQSYSKMSQCTPAQLMYVNENKFKKTMFSQW